MKTVFRLFRLVSAFVLVTGAFVQTVFVPMAHAAAAGRPAMEELPVQPLSDVLTAVAKPVTKPNRMPIIAWGGDIATVYGVMSGIFQKEGVPLELFDGNDFLAQSQGSLNGESPYVRGTMSMMLQAAAAFEKAGVPLVILLQETWSSGGDTIVVRGDLKKIADLRGKTIGLQLYGPHIELLGTLLQSANLSPSDVKLKWFRNLNMPKKAGPKIQDAVSAFANDSSLDAVMAISPDAAYLTSGENKISGKPHVMFTTAQANRVTADVIAVRKDYYDANRETVTKVTRAWFKSQEALADLVANKAKRAVEYQQLAAKAASEVLGDPSMTTDVDGLLGDCTFVGLSGTVGFFTGKFPDGQGTLRNVENMSKELSQPLIDMKLLRSPGTVAVANWDFSKLGLKGSGAAPTITVAIPKVVSAKTQAAVEVAVEDNRWAKEGKMFEVEITFAPMESAFPAAQYASDYDSVLKLAQTYAGSLVVIEGFVDPEIVQKMKDNNDPQAGMFEQSAKNLSQRRAQAVRDAFVGYAKAKGLAIDETQLVVVGRGISSPKFPKAKGPEQSAQNRRVTFGVTNLALEK